VRLRIDGVMVDLVRLPNEMGVKLTALVKIIGDIDVTQKSIVQEGHFAAKVPGRKIDYRLSFAPSVFGQKLVIRVQDSALSPAKIRDLNLPEWMYQEVAATIPQDQGMVLVCGPTGSGKTTTLYSLIRSSDTGRKNFVTIEDPVEIQIEGVTQLPVDESEGKSFSALLRSVLRQDPDSIMVGEIRDPETAEIAVQSALTGHLVYTTVHANSVFDVLGRFRHMGVDAYNLVSALNAVLAQRLVRLNCRACAVEERPDRALLAASGIPSDGQEAFLFMRGRGCPECRGTGYKGRKAIGELLVMNDELSELVIARKPVRVLREAAIAAGTIPLRQAALELARRGESTLEEVNRVTLVA